MGDELRELHCSGCDRYIRFRLSLDVDGRYAIQCPVCKDRVHYRFVRDGTLTDGKQLHYMADLPKMKCTPLTVESAGYFSFFDLSASATMRASQAWMDKEG